MFKIAGRPILVDDMLLLTELKNQLAINGINLFHKFKRSSNNIQFCCPVHNEGQERKPSCGILTSDKDDKPAGTVHCFTCGYTATLDELISRCFGYDDKGEFGKNWVIKNFVMVDSEDRTDINLDLSRNNKRNIIQYIEEDMLETYRFYHQYMYDRKLTNEIIDLFDVGYDEDNNCLTFPVRDILGRTLFIARRSVKTKFFNYPEGVDKPLYGIFELSKNTKEIIICESVLNALTCWVYGKPAIALLGLGSSNQIEQINKLSVRKIILGLDPDEKGIKASEKLKKLIKNKIVTQLVYPDLRDINDLDYHEFNSLQERY